LFLFSLTISAAWTNIPPFPGSVFPRSFYFFFFKFSIVFFKSSSLLALVPPLFFSFSISYTTF
jgi:hypothetical protein